jgi:hypothetical protein
MYDFRRLACTNRTLMRISQDRALGFKVPLGDVRTRMKLLFWHPGMTRSDCWDKILKYSGLSVDFQHVFFVLFESLISKVKEKCYYLAYALNRCQLPSRFTMRVFEMILPEQLLQDIIVRPYHQIRTTGDGSLWGTRDIKGMVLGVWTATLNDNRSHKLWHNAVDKYLRMFPNNNSTVLTNTMAMFGELLFHWLIQQSNRIVDVHKVTRRELGWIFATEKPLRLLVWKIVN